MASPVSRELNPIVPQIPHMQVKWHPKMRGKPCESADGCEPNARPAVSHRTNASMRGIELEKSPAGKKQPKRQRIRARPVESQSACPPIRETHDQEFAGTMLRIRECARVGYGRYDRRYNLNRIP